MSAAAVATTRTRILQRLKAVVGDVALTRTEGVVLTAIISHADRDGRAWPGVRRLCGLCRCSASTVASATAKGLASGHLALAGKGPGGAAEFVVLAVPPDEPDVPDEATASATVAVAPAGDESATVAVALPDGKALRSADESATLAAESATLGGKSATVRSSARNIEEKTEKREREGRAGDGDGARDADGEREPPPGDPKQRILSLSFPNGSSGKQQQQLLNAVDRAALKGVPYPLMAHAVRSRALEGPPWKQVDATVETARECVEWVNEAMKRRRFTGLDQVLDFVDAGGEVLCATVHVARFRGVLKLARTWPNGPNGPDARCTGSHGAETETKAPKPRLRKELHR